MARPTNATLDAQAAAHSTAPERILEAAREHFRLKGLAGARMHEIATDAGVNKAMLHYYYRTKEELFDAVFRHDTEAFRRALVALMLGPAPLEAKIEAFVGVYMQAMLPNPHIPVFMITTVAQFPERLQAMLAQTPQLAQAVQAWRQTVADAVAAGRIRPIGADQLYAHILGTTAMAFIAQPMIARLFELDAAAYRAFLEARGREVPAFILSGLRP